MDAPALRRSLTEELISFCWDQWAQMGVSAGFRTARSAWSMDVEALVLLSMSMEQEDPRLAEVVEQWAAHNKRLLNAWRLQSLEQDASACGAGDHDLLPRLRAAGGPAWPPSEHAAEEIPTTAMVAEPDLAAPINLGPRLRQLLGNGSRAEVMRILLGLPQPLTLSTRKIAALAAYSKRNTQEALGALTAARAVEVLPEGRRQDTYRARHEAWAPLLELESPGEIPRLVFWPQTFRVLMATRSWLGWVESQKPSAYLETSEAGELLRRLEGDLAFIGYGPPTGAGINTYLSQLEHVIALARSVLEGAPPRR